MPRYASRGALVPRTPANQGDIRHNRLRLTAVNRACGSPCFNNQSGLPLLSPLSTRAVRDGQSTPLFEAATPGDPCLWSVAGPEAAFRRAASGSDTLTHPPIRRARHMAESVTTTTARSRARQLLIELRACRHRFRRWPGCRLVAKSHSGTAEAFFNLLKSLVSPDGIEPPTSGHSLSATSWLTSSLGRVEPPAAHAAK